MTNTTAHDITVNGNLFRTVNGETEALRVAFAKARSAKRSIIEVTAANGAVIWTSN